MRHKACPGPLVQLLRGTQLLDAAVAHDRDAIAQDERFLLVVRDKNERDAQLPLQVEQLDLQFLAQLQVQRAQRLI